MHTMTEAPPKNPDVIVTPHSIALVGHDAIKFGAAVQLRAFIRLYIKTGIIPTRGVTITRMLALCQQFTGKTYKPAQKEQALEDLTNWIETMRLALQIVNE